MLKVFMIKTVCCTFFEFLVEQQTFPGDLPTPSSVVRAEDREMGTCCLPGASSQGKCWAQMCTHSVTVTMMAVTAITVIYWLSQRKESDPVGKRNERGALLL